MNGSESFLGAGNTLTEYLLVLLVYAMMFVLMRFGTRRVAPDFHRSFIALYLFWGIGVFVGNYILYLLGAMSFLPWLDNAIHTLIWIGLCLSFLYAGCYTLPIWEQCALFVIFSFLVKVAEHLILGTWEHVGFFGLGGNWAYIIGWSLMDIGYPFVTVLMLRLVSRYVSGIVVPKLNGSL